MAHTTLFVRKHDGPLWDAARRVAERRRISLSQLVAESLAAHLPNAAAAPDPAERWAHIASDAA